MHPLQWSRFVSTLKPLVATALTAAMLASWACAIKPRRPAARDPEAGVIPTADGAPAPMVGKPGSFAAFCGQFARLWCQGNLSCCKEPTERHASLAECEQGYERECQLYFADPVYSNCVVYDKDAAHAELVLLASLVSTCSPGGLKGWYRLFKGTTPPGGDCSYSLTNTGRIRCCQPGTRCVASSGIVGGQIEARCEGGLKQLGETCSGGSCVDGTYCAPGADGGEWNCVAQKPTGAGCVHSYECSSEICMGGTCKALDSQMLYCGKARDCVAVGAFAYNNNCGMSWRCGGQQELTTDCKKEGDGWRCTCERNHVQEKTFASSSVCSLKSQDFHSTIGTGCGWKQVVW